MGKSFIRIRTPTGDVVDLAALRARVSVTRRLNEASELELSVPRGASLQVGVGALIEQVQADGSVTARGRISSRDLTDTEVIYGAFLDAILLENNVTPANYTGALRNMLLADFAEHVLDGWRTLRANLAAPQAGERVDTTTEPGRLMLAKDSGGAYHGSGFAVFRFNSSNVNNFTRWDRIRWASDYADNVKTTMQWREGTTGAWSPEVVGVDPSSAGLPIPSTASTVEVRINLSTDDTETPNEVPEGESPTAFGFTPRVFNVEAIARTEGAITVGSITAANDVFVRNPDADLSNSLRLLQEACAETGHEFTVTNGQLFLSKQLGVDRTNDFILQANTNVNISVLRDDDEELVNRLHAYGPGSEDERPYAFLEDTQSVLEYGPRESAEVFDTADWQAAAQAHLAARSTPVQQFEVTGHLEHLVNLGDTVRIADPTSGVVTTTRATEVIETISPTEGSLVTFLLGNPPKGLAQRIIDEANESEERELQLGLPAPLVTARPAAPGFTVSLSNPSRSRAVRYEVFVSRTPAFTLDRNLVWANGPHATWVFPNAEPGELHYVRVIAYDRLGEASPESQEVIVRAAGVPAEALDPSVQADIARGVAVDAYVAANKAAWEATAQLVDARGEFWDSAAAQLDGTLILSEVQSATASGVTGEDDFEAAGVSPGDLIRVNHTDGSLQVRVVAQVAGAQLVPSQPFDPVPAAGAELLVGRVNEVAARTETTTNQLVHSEIGRVEANLTGDPLQSDYSSVQQTAEWASTSLQRQENHLLLSGIVTAAGGDTLTDNGADFESDGIMPGDQVLILDGPAAGITRDISHVTSNSLTLAKSWPAGKTPSAGAAYLVGRVQSVTSSLSERTAERWSSIISKLDGPPGSTGQFSSIEQLHNAINLVVGDVTALEDLVESIESGYGQEPMFTNDGQSMRTNAGQEMVTSQPMGLQQVFAAITLANNRIDLVVNENAQQWSTINQQADSIQLAVRKDDVLNSINVSGEGIRIAGNRIRLTGETLFGNDFAIGSGQIADDAVTRDKIKNGEITGVLIADGAVTATKVAAGAITAGKIAAGAITTDKLTTGALDITASGRTTGRIRVRDTSGNLRSQYGRLRDNNDQPLPGVPDADRYGLWLDANELYIPGAGITRATRGGHLQWTHQYTVGSASKRPGWETLPEQYAEIMFDGMVNRPYEGIVAINAASQSITGHEDRINEGDLSIARVRVHVPGAHKVQARTTSGFWLDQPLPPGQPSVTYIRANNAYSYYTGMRWFFRPEIWLPPISPAPPQTVTITHTVSLLWFAIVNDQI